MVWTGGQLLKVVGDPMIALLPILGFGSLTFLALHYLLYDDSSRRSHSESPQVQHGGQPDGD